MLYIICILYIILYICDYTLYIYISHIILYILYIHKSYNKCASNFM